MYLIYFKLKKLVLIFVAIILVSFSLIEKKKSTHQTKIDLKSAYVFWRGSSSFISQRGTVKLKSGFLTIANKQLISGEFVVDMRTIHNREGLEKLEEHLKSVDFFEVEKYPTSKFVITNVIQEKNKVKITGNLTIKDITKSITVNGVILENDKSFLLKSEVFKLNRAEFHVKYMSKSFFKNLKDKFINDEVDMSFLIGINK